MMNKNVIVITGPTASGKTDFALKLAEYGDIEIISADSRQIYRYMNIGTAKPNEEELSRVEHHLIDILNPDEEFSAGKFAEISKSIIYDIIARGKIPVVAGGTGFYIKALFEGLSSISDIENEKRLVIRSELNDLLIKNGKEFLFEMLLQSDSESAEKYSDKNPRRVIRALEYIKLTGNKFSDTFGKEGSSGLVPQYYVLNPAREILYKKINQRTDEMFDNGLIKEVVKIIEMGYSFELNSLNTVGYKECISLITGEITLERAIELTKQNTRRYAKRQVTWLNQIENFELIEDKNSNTFSKIIENYRL